MNSKLYFVLSAIGCGLCLTAFTIVPGIIRYAFSLGAFFIGFRFFGVFESWKTRSGLIVLTVVFFFIFLGVYTVLALTNDWYHPGRMMEGM